MGKFADLGHDRARELLNRIPAEFLSMDELCELLHIIDCHYERRKQLAANEEVAKMRGNMERLKELWKKWDDCGPAKAFVQQLDDLIHGKPLSFYPNCQMCEECDGDPNCPWYGEPDGCNNRELRAYVLEHEKENK